jgi:hypothetical protein
LEEEAPLLEPASSLMLMTSFSLLGTADDEGFRGTLTPGVIGIEAGEGLVFFF